MSTKTLCPTDNILPAPAPRRPFLRRCVAALIAAACLALLAVATCVQPDPAGLGPHQQLHLPPCGFYLQHGFPCPTCGMTTAFAHAVRGHFLQAFVTQPAGALAALICMIAAVLATYSALFGRPLPKFFPSLAALSPLTGFLGIIIIVLAAWLWCCALVWFHHP
jgi:hypothetical protein